MGSLANLFKAQSNSLSSQSSHRSVQGLRPFQPELALVLAGILFGYAVFLQRLGLRPITIISGAVISGGAIASWLIPQLYHQRLEENRDRAQHQENLLDWSTFQQRLRPLSAHIPTSAQKQWQIAEAQIQTIHQMCQRIARQESLFLAAHHHN